MRKLKKQKNRRDKIKHPALDKRFMPRVRQELIDFDYIDQLNEEEKNYLNKFVDEYINASFKKDGTDIQSYEKYGKDSNDRNNARNRCLYSALKNKANKHNNKRLVNYDAVGAEIENQASREIDPQHIENAYIDFIELKEIESYLEEYDQMLLHLKFDE